MEPHKYPLPGSWVNLPRYSQASFQYSAPPLAYSREQAYNRAFAEQYRDDGFTGSEHSVGTSWTYQSGYGGREGYQARDRYERPDYQSQQNARARWSETPHQERPGYHHPDRRWYGAYEPAVNGGCHGVDYSETYHDREYYSQRRRPSGEYYDDRDYYSQRRQPSHESYDIRPTTSASQCYHTQQHYGQLPAWHYGFAEYVPSHQSTQQHQPQEQQSSRGTADRSPLTQSWQAAGHEVPSPPPPPPPEPRHSLRYNRNDGLVRQNASTLVAPGIMNRIYQIDKTTRYDQRPALGATSHQPAANRAFLNNSPHSSSDHRIPPPWSGTVDTRGSTYRSTPTSVGSSMVLTRSQARLLSQGPSDVAGRRGASPYSGVATSSLQLPTRPEPTATYLKQANAARITMETPRPLLVVLDLNGTLLYRKNKGSSFTGRPKVHEFLRYLFSSHDVMVWSSARPHNVDAICQNLLSKEQFQALVAKWSREDLRLHPTAYNAKVQVYKQLSWIWEDETVRAKNPSPVDYWSQGNTVLIDDTIAKAVSEPHNLIQIEEFEGKEEQMESDLLAQVVKYLEVLRFERDVSAYMRRKPFVYDETAEAFDWKLV